MIRATGMDRIFNDYNYSTYYPLKKGVPIIFPSWISHYVLSIKLIKEEQQ